MARGFGATLGVGSTDKILTLGVGDATTRSYFLRIFPRVAFTGTQMFWRQLLSGTYVAQFYYSSLAFHFYITQASGANAGHWTFNPSSTGVWSSIGLTYYKSDNTIIYYLNETAPGTTTITLPSTTPPDLSGASFAVGNAEDGSVPIDGCCADFAVWNTPLTNAEFFSMSRGRRPSQIRPKSLLVYLPINGQESPEPDFSGLALNGTVTGTAFRPGPPVAMLTPRWPNNDFTTSVPPSFIPAWAAQSNLPVIGAGTY